MLHPLPRRLGLLAVLLVCVMPITVVLHGRAAAQTGGPGNPTLIGPLDGATGQFNPVVLRWNTAVNTLSYDVAYLDSTVSSTYSYSGSLTTTSYTLPTMPNGHLIYWEVFACDASSCSGQSPLWSFSMTAPAPGAPPLVSPNNVSGTGTTPTLSWNQPSGVIAGVTVYSATVADGDTGTAMGTTGYSFSLSVAVPASFNLVYGKSYTWNVTACNAGACSGWGPSWDSFSTANAPAAPVIVSPDNVSGIGAMPTLYWSPSSDAIAGVTQSYAGVFDGDTGATMGITAGTTGTSATVPAGFGLVLGKSYTWNAYACNGWSCSGWGPTWDAFTTSPPPDRPVESAPLNYSAAEGITPTVSWTAPTNSVSGITTYTVGVWLLNWQDGTSTTLPTLAAGTALAQPIPSSEGLVAGLSYFWAVYGCNDWSCGDWSATEWLFSTAPAPSAAQQTAPADGATNTGTSVTLTWNASTQNNNPAPGQTHYYADVYDQNTGQFVQQNASIGISTSDALPTLTTGDVYRWIVTACNGADTEQDCMQTLSTAGPTYTWPEFFTAPVPQAPWPGVTTTLYIDYSSAQNAQDLGFWLGNRGEPTGLVLLNFLRQDYTNGEGTFLWTDGPTSIDTDKQIAISFMQGYAAAQSNLPVTIALGTTNFDDSSVEGRTYSLAGQDWAQFVLSVVAAANDPQNGIRGDFIVDGAVDMEQDWNTAANSRAWVRGYGGVSGAPPLYNFGTCEGCNAGFSYMTSCAYHAGQYCNIPSAGIILNNSWSVDDVYYVSYGNSIAQPLPEIYGDVFAREWAYVALYGTANDPQRVPDAHGFVFAGELTQCVADLGPNAPDGLGYPPSKGFGAVWNWLFNQPWAPYIIQAPRWSTDIGYEHQYFTGGVPHVLQPPTALLSACYTDYPYP